MTEPEALEKTKLELAIERKTEDTGIKRFPAESITYIYLGLEEFNDLLDVILKATRSHLEDIVYSVTDIRGLLQKIGTGIKRSRAPFKRITEHRLSTNEEEHNQDSVSPSQPPQINLRLADRLEAKILLLELPSVRADAGILLATILAGLEKHVVLVDKFLALESNDQKAIVNTLIEMRDNLETVYEYVKTARRILYWIEYYCYSDDEESV
jgi:hypothetical protein